MLSWRLSGNRECTEERKSQVTLYTKLVTGILTGEAVVVGMFFPLGIYQRGAHKRTANVLGQDQALVFMTHQGLWNGGQGLDAVLWGVLGVSREQHIVEGSAGDRVVLEVT